MMASIDILLVEDNPGDVRLTMEALKEAHVQRRIHSVTDGEEALSFLKKCAESTDKPLPSLILLDLNLPKKDGREVLEQIKNHPALKRIPVVVLTTSRADADVMKAYNLHANCYVTKPAELELYIDVIKSIQEFWLGTVRLPSI
jgi:two-component system, chemotaxis family, response regulator Rcp1